MGAILGLIYWALNLFLIALIGRLILDYIRVFSPSWRPQGVVLAIAELIYSITDKPFSFNSATIVTITTAALIPSLSFTFAASTQ